MGYSVKDMSYATYPTTRLNEVLSKLKDIVARADFVRTKDKLTRKDKIILKLADLTAGTSSHYFSPETKLFISSIHIGKADVLRAMTSRGETLSRSGLEGRLFADAKKFVKDFGIDAVTVLSTEQITAEMQIRLDAIELTLLNITTGLDYCDNILDNLLRTNGLAIDNINGFSSVEDITQEQLDLLVELLEPYTEAGKAKRKAELMKLSHVLWHFRKANLDGSDNATVNYILRSLI